MKKERKTEEEIYQEGRENFLQQAGILYDNLHRQDRLLEIVEERLEGTVVPMLADVYGPGDRIAFEDVIDVEDHPSGITVEPRTLWRDMEPDNRDALVGAIGDYLGVDLRDRENYSYKKHYIETVKDDGRFGVSGEQEVDVIILSTDNPLVHILIHNLSEIEDEPGLRERYSLLRVEGDLEE